MSSGSEASLPPPYVAPVAMPGLVPATHIDAPISAVLIAFCVAILVSSLAIIKQNARFKVSSQLVVWLAVYPVFCMTALTLRIACAAVAPNPNLTIAANIFANIGVVILVVFQLLLMPRLVRQFFGTRNAIRGWRQKVSVLPFFIPIPLMPIMLIMNINVVILSFFTLDSRVRQNCLTSQKVALTVFSAAAFVPVPASLVIAVLGPGSSKAAASANKRSGFIAKVGNLLLGTGSVRGSALLILFASLLVTVGTSMRAVTLLLPARNANDPAWYHDRPPYYIFTYALEILAVMAHLVFRSDRRFQGANQATKVDEGVTDPSNSLD
jgi:hypothetical protein